MMKTERLILDEFSGKDAFPLFQIAQRINQQANQDPNYHSYYAFQTQDIVELREKVANFIIKAKQEQKQTPRKTFRYALRKDGQLIGSVAIDMLPTIENGKVILGDLGYFIDPLHGRKNYTHEACIAVLHQFFAKYETLDVTAHPNNQYSIQLIKRLGGVATDYQTNSHYNQEPRQSFIISRSSFIDKLYNQKRLTEGKEYV